MIPTGSYKIDPIAAGGNSVRFKGPGKEIYAKFEDKDGNGLIERSNVLYWNMTESKGQHTNILTTVTLGQLSGKVTKGSVTLFSSPSSDKEIHENLKYTPQEAYQKIQNEFLPVAKDAKLVGALERYNHENDTYQKPVILQEADNSAFNYLVHIEGKDGKSSITFRTEKNPGAEIDLKNVTEATLSDRKKSNTSKITEWNKNNNTATLRTVEFDGPDGMKENKKMITSQDATKSIFDTSFKLTK